MKTARNMRPVLRRCLGALLAVAIVSMLVAACSRSDGPAGETTLQRIKRTGVIRIGYANEAPYAYVDPETGKLTGESPEVLRHVVKSMGIEKMEGVLTEFGSLIPGLRAGRFDVIAAGMYITPERAAEISFSNPTYSIGEGFIVQKGNPLNLHSYEDLVNNSKARLGVVAGAIEQQYAKALKVPSDRLVVFPDAPSAVAGVISGRIEAYGGTSLTVRNMLKKADNDRLELADPFTDPVIEGKAARGYGAFGIRKEDEQLRDEINKQLAAFIGTPEHLALVKPLGFTKGELPGKATAEELSQP
jgi:polar amino acid transport system substrate-binding protein